MRSNQLSYAPRTCLRQSTTRVAGGQVPAPARLRALALLLALLLSACQMQGLRLPLATASPAATATAADGWRQLAPGLELRRSMATGSLLGQAHALRVDPQRFRLRAHYRPGEALTLAGWREALPGAPAFINANFFDRSQRVNGLLVADGVSHGRPWLTRGGAFLLRDGVPQLRPSQERPWSAGPMQQAVQGFPMLVLDGEPVYRRSGPPARRSIVALDGAGRVLLLATPLLGPSLAETAAWLASSDLDIESALNLDGGGSTLFYVDGIDEVTIPSLDAVPALLAVWPRQ